MAMGKRVLETGSLAWVVCFCSSLLGCAPADDPGDSVERVARLASLRGQVELIPEGNPLDGARVVAGNRFVGPESYVLLRNGARAPSRIIPRNPSVRLGGLILMPPLQQADGSIREYARHGSNSYRTRLRLPTVALFELVDGRPNEEPLTEQHWDLSGSYHFADLEPGPFVLCIHRPDAEPETIHVEVAGGDEIELPGILRFRFHGEGFEEIQTPGLPGPPEDAPSPRWAAARDLRWHAGKFERLE